MILTKFDAPNRVADGGNTCEPVTVPRVREVERKEKGMETANIKIKKYRLEKGLTQEDLAHATGLSQGYIASIERGMRTPSLAVLGDMASCLGIDVAKLFSTEELEQDKAVIKDIGKMMSIVDDWLESHGVRMSKDSRSELVILLLEDHTGKTLDDKRIRKIEKQISHIAKIIENEKNEFGLSTGP